MPVWNMHERYGDASTDGIYGRDHGVPERRGWPPGANLSERDAHHRSLFFFFFLLLRLMCCPLILVRNISLMLLLPSCSSRPLLCLGSLFFPSPHLSFMNAQTINNRGRSVVLGCGAVPSFFFFWLLRRQTVHYAMRVKSRQKTKEKGTTDPGRRVIYGRVFARTDKFRSVSFQHTHIHACIHDGYWVPPFSQTLVLFGQVMLIRLVQFLSQPSLPRLITFVRPVFNAKNYMNSNILLSARHPFPTFAGSMSNYGIQPSDWLLHALFGRKHFEQVAEFIVMRPSTQLFERESSKVDFNAFK